MPSYRNFSPTEILVRALYTPDYSYLFYFYSFTNIVRFHPKSYEFHYIP
jgi:hypothetical protein